MFATPFYVFEKAIPVAVIDAIRAEAANLRTFPGRVGPGDGAELEFKRSSLVAFFSQDHWVSGILYHYAALANARSWRFSVVAPSSAQVAFYREGSFFDWHSDYAPGSAGEAFERKISVVINISGNPGPIGGTLELRPDWSDWKAAPAQLEQLSIPGSVAVFPSLIPHRVTPITSGERVTLTSWIVGPPLE